MRLKDYKSICMICINIRDVIRGSVCRYFASNEIKNERDPAIELYRCLMMFGIVFLHSACRTIGSFTWENAIGKWCVDGFVYISGYCGIRRFSCGKVLRLYFIAVFVILFMNICENVVFHGSVVLSAGLHDVLDLLRKFWFLHAYVVVMALAPIMNVAMEREDSLVLVLPFLCVIFLWGFACELPILNKVTIGTSGISSFSGFTLTAAYVVGRLYRRGDWDCKLNAKYVFVILPILIVIVCLGFHNRDGIWMSGWFSNYNSPFSIAIATCAFYFLHKVRPSGLCKKCILFLAPSMFPVYIIHGQPIWWESMKTIGSSYVELYCPALVVLVMAVVVFLGSVLCDLPRRMLSVSIQRISTGIGRRCFLS